MLVLCVGLNRSGSTLQYNIARGMICNKFDGNDFGYLNDKRHIYNIVSSLGDYKKLDHAIIKTHNYYSFYEDDSLANRSKMNFLCTFRDLRDVTLSIMRHHNLTFETVIKREVLQKEIEKYYKFKELRPLLMQNHSDLLDNLPKAITDIAQFFKIHLSETEVLSLTKEYSLTNQKKQIKKYTSTIRCRLINSINSLFIKLNPTSRRPSGLITNVNKLTWMHYNHIAERTTNWQSQLSASEKHALKPILSDWLIDAGFEKDDSW